MNHVTTKKELPNEEEEKGFNIKKEDNQGTKEPKKSILKKGNIDMTKEAID